MNHPPKRRTPTAKLAAVLLELLDEVACEAVTRALAEGRDGIDEFNTWTARRDAWRPILEEVARGKTE